MDMLEVLNALRRLKAGQRTASSKTAYAFLKVASETQLDLMARLLVLEGAADVPLYKWARNPARGLRQAQAVFGSTEIDPAFLSPSNSGMYGFLRKKANSMLRTPQLDGDDLLQNALAGLGAYKVGPNGEITYSKRENKFRSVGAYLSGKIKSGSNDLTYITNRLAAFIKRDAIDVIRATQNKNRIAPPVHIDSPENQEGIGQLADPRQGGQSAFDMIFYSKDPVATKVRLYLKQVIETQLPKSVRPTMLAWWEALHFQREFLTGRDLAFAAGYIDETTESGSKADVAAKKKVKDHWVKSVEVFFKALNSDRMPSSLSTRLLAMGVDIDDIDWSHIAKNEKTYGRVRRYGSTKLVDAVYRLANDSPLLHPYLMRILRSEGL